MNKWIPTGAGKARSCQFEIILDCYLS